jgi:hypothetical protein
MYHESRQVFKNMSNGGLRLALNDFRVNYMEEKQREAMKQATAARKAAEAQLEAEVQHNRNFVTPLTLELS